MFLRKLPVNQAWVFLFGNTIEKAQIITLDGWPRSFPTRKEAIEAARQMGLVVDGKGNVSVAR